MKIISKIKSLPNYIKLFIIILFLIPFTFMVWNIFGREESPSNDNSNVENLSDQNITTNPIDANLHLYLKNNATGKKVLLDDDNLVNSNNYQTDLEYLLDNVLVHNNVFYYTINNGLYGIDLNTESTVLEFIFEKKYKNPDFAENEIGEIDFKIFNSYLYVWNTLYLTSSTLYRIDLNNPDTIEEVDYQKIIPTNASINYLNVIDNEIIFTTIDGDDGDYWGNSSRYSLVDETGKELIRYGSYLGVGKRYCGIFNHSIYFTEANCISCRTVSYPENENCCYDNEEDQAYIYKLYEIDITNEIIKTIRNWNLEDGITYVLLNNDGHVVTMNEKYEVRIENLDGEVVNSLDIDSDKNKWCHFETRSTELEIVCSEVEYLYDSVKNEFIEAPIYSNDIEGYQKIVDNFNLKLNLQKYNYKLIIE